MNIFMSLWESFKEHRRIDKKIHSPNSNGINDLNIFDEFSLYAAWASGDSSVIENIYKKLPEKFNNSFWKAAASVPICKRHSGIPKIILKALVNIIDENYDGIEFDNDDIRTAELWKLIEKDNSFPNIVSKSVEDTLIYGEGAYKLMYIPEISQYPIIDFVPGNKCEINIKYGRLIEIVFCDNTYHDNAGNGYTLKEYYKKGCIEYKLFDDSNKEVPLTKLPETADLNDIYFSDSEFIAAIPCKFINSNRIENHGESLFAGKADIFDMVDETVSQYSQTIRVGGPDTYVPKDCLDFDPETGTYDTNKTVMNPFFTINLTNPLEGDNKIQVVQSAINSEDYGRAMSQEIALACAGIISPSTISITLQDTALISSDSGESQREKEKQTLYTINKIKNSLYDVLPTVVVTTLKLYNMLNGQNSLMEKDDVIVKFSEYANPSFESQMETLHKANPNIDVLTIDELVEELYGDTKSEEEKDKIKRDMYIINYGVESIDELLEQKKMAIQQLQNQDKKAVQQENKEKAVQKDE